MATLLAEAAIEDVGAEHLRGLGLGTGPVSAGVPEGLEVGPSDGVADEREAWREAVRLATASLADEREALASDREAEELAALVDEDLDKAERLGAEVERLRKEAAALWGAAKRWDDCGKVFFAHFCQDHPERAVKSACSCNSRICPDCQRRYRSRLLASWQPLFEAIQEGRFQGAGPYRFKHLVTTKRRRPGEDVGQQVRQCLEDTKRLIYKFWRRGGDWKGRGAIVTAEIGPQGGNIHCHALVLGQWVKQSALSEEWARITSGDTVVFIRDCSLDSVGEVVKYALKAEELAPAEAVSVMLSLRGTRRLRCYGLFYNNEALRIPDPEPMTCGTCGRRLTTMLWEDWEELYGSQRELYVGALLADAIEGRSGRSPP